MSRFCVLPSRVISDSRMTSMTHLRVLMALCTFTDKNGWAFPSRRVLGEQVNVSVARVSQCIGDLRDWGYIEVHAQSRTSDGGQTANRYRVLFDVGAPAELPADPVSDAHPPVSAANPPVSTRNLPPRKSLAFTPVVNAPSNDPSNRTYTGGREETRDELFEQAWAAYPQRAGGNSKRDALKAWKARLANGESPEAMLAGTVRYAAFCAITKKLNTEFVKQAATFFGPAKHFAEPWSASCTCRRRSACRPC